MNMSNGSSGVNGSTSSPPIPVPSPPPIHIQWLVIGIITGITNASLLLFIIFNRKLHSITNFILCSKLVIGFCFGIIYVIPRQAIPFISSVAILCDFIPQLGTGLMINLNLHVCLISFHRYFLIINPFRYKERATSRNVVIVLTSTWLLSIFIAAIPLFTFRPIHGIQCITLGDINAETVYLSSVFIILFLVPLVVLVATYGKILVIVLTLHKNHVYPAGDKSANISIKTNRKALIQAAVMIGIFFCLFVPFVVGVIIFFFALRAGKVGPLVPVLTATQYPAFCYPALSPILNILFMSDIRVEVVNFVRASYSNISGDNNSYTYESSQAQRRRKTLTSNF
ncbi:D(5)-like dopamine receptor [Trichoplax sp. H2]|uniref:G-protein coupled receptors family 1 profile domain-containing protein n=1 Tax=Trichoplax adhaerens TaxID=10228 RepID=B3RQ48_TRIAD|nr:hypothetical protein TRIADDRAFT_53775 [Trichoplax adhaerens]EDV27757.1 hypothetical protein TRIADDRAFT_53775 [Trichoplax adhaerens]RDD40752.1 D(5)-like dopamine receptor [Trichoplax sp. H2]|eukprot:XP_002109591.1 hypothetical protein TRIADDRAFT_53775 [Trichoplax adhaerens]